MTRNTSRWYASAFTGLTAIWMLVVGAYVISTGEHFSLGSQAAWVMAGLYVLALILTICGDSGFERGCVVYASSTLALILAVLSILIPIPIFQGSVLIVCALLETVSAVGLTKQ